MAIYDTSNTIDNSIFLKAKLPENMVGDNYYIENLQNKRDLDWKYRYNVVNIEEELNKQISYSNEEPLYTPIDAVITSVKSETGADLGTAWASLSFRNLKHPNHIGKRYRFSLDFPDMAKMTEEEKYYQTSVWLAVNKSPIKPGNSCMVRKCNTSIALLGSPNKSNNNITEVRYEPCVLDIDAKYVQVYYDEVVPIPQGDAVLTLQLNYFTNQIKINDRIMFGVVNDDDRSNNSLFKVKAVIKSIGSHTFMKDSKDEIESTRLLIIALDKDEVHPDDNFTDRIPESAPIYKTEEVIPAYTYNIKVEEPYEQRIIVGDTQEYITNLYYNGIVKPNIEFTYNVKLNGIIEKNWPNYFAFEKIGINKFTVKNLKACNRGKLEIQAKCYNPDDPTKIVEQVFEIELGGFY